MVNECLLRLMESWSPETNREMGRKGQRGSETEAGGGKHSFWHPKEIPVPWWLLKVPKCSDKNKLSLKGS